MEQPVEAARANRRLLFISVILLIDGLHGIYDGTAGRGQVTPPKQIARHAEMTSPLNMGSAQDQQGFAPSRKKNPAVHCGYAGLPAESHG